MEDGVEIVPEEEKRFAKWELMADNYTVTKLLYKDETIILSQGVRERDDLPIIIKTLRMNSPSPRLIERLKHEYEISQQLSSDHAVKVYALITIESKLNLIMEDFGGVPLELTHGNPVDSGRFFDIAIQLAAALADIHIQGIIHKDIKPGNILINPQTGMIKLSDFGIASTISKTPIPENFPCLIEGTLAYISPEQTCRMNRALDHRSDLYSLGVTLYEMLTGKLPFQAKDPLEWVHCHIARKPQAPAELLSSIPQMVSEIILKLLAKQADERYQSAKGLQFDLQRCKEEYALNGKIEPFHLGEHDISELFLISGKLYGRDEHISILLKAFKNVVETGLSELILVSGYSGIGKSALVGELYKPIVQEWGYFISGKYDQLKRNIPYSIFASAFHDFIAQILTESEDRVRMWKNELQNALGENGQLMVDIIPQIELVIGKQPQISDLPPAEAEKRLNAVFQRFIGVIADKEHPLTLFLDDLQWLDSESLKLIENIIMNQQIRYLFLIGAYRDNEVTSTHPLMIAINQLKKKKAPIKDIVLTPLSVEHVLILIQDTFHRKDKYALPLARLVYNKTGGNPFFVIQFITELWEEQLITFDMHSRTWRWDIKKIRTKGFTENIIDLMVGKLHRLPAATQNFLKIAACIGNTSKVHMLAIALGQPEDKIHHHLKEAINEGLMIRNDGTYQFLHDRMQEAAYSLIPNNRHAAHHLRIGRLLLAGMAKKQIEEDIFEILNQLNRGATLITDYDEKYKVAELNLMGAKKAISSMAYTSAATYLSSGLSKLSPDSWEKHYELTYDLYYNLAECKYLIGIFDESDRFLSFLLEHAKTIVEKANVYRVLIALHTTKGDMEKAIEFGIEGMRLFGMELESHPSREEVEMGFSNVWEMLGERPIEELIDIPPMVDKEMKIAMNLLADLGTPAIFARRNLLHITLAHMVTISIRKGNTDASVWGYTWFGATLVQRDFAKYRDGYRFGKLAYDLMMRNNLSQYKAKVCIMFGDNTNFYVNHIRTDRKYIEMAYSSAIENGDQIWACYSCNHIITNMLTVGDPLCEVWDESVRRLEFVRKAKDPNIEDIIISQQRFILNMQGLTSHYSSFSDSSFKQDEFEKHISKSQMQLMVCWYYILKMQALFIYNCIDKAIEASKMAGGMILASGPDIQGADYEFFAALALAAHFRSASPEEQEDHIAKISNHRKLLHDWAENCPENFLHRYTLVSAELARITGKEFEAERLYEQAIESAHMNGFVQNQAIANELVARFYRERGFERTADSYLREALGCYERWGADGKARQLKQQFPQLMEIHPFAHTLTITALQEQFDVMAVLKALQSISQEIMLPGLQETLMRIVLEYSGAQRGFFLLVDDDKLKIQSYAEIKGNEIKVENFSYTSDALPLSILNYVRRTRETVILPDKIKSPIFASDEYIILRHPRSVLCLPIVLQTRVAGMIYLENDLLDPAFTPGVLTVLELLASQVAISLENARLYENRKKNIEALSNANEYIQQLIESANVMIIGLDPSGNIKMFNKAARLITGYNMEELRGVNWFEKIVPKNRYPHIWKTFHDYQQRTGTLPVNFENPILTKSREERIISWQNSSILGLHGDISTISFGMDITERKRIEEASNRLASIVEYSEDAIIGKTVDGIIMSWNPGAEKLYGYSENEVINRHISILLPPGHYDEMPAILERIKKGETIEHFEAVRNRKDGKLIDVFLTISPIKDVEGRITGASTIARDITEHKIMEKKLHAASLYARNLIEASLDPLVTISARGKILDVNSATEVVTGRSREELIGSDFSDYFTEPEKARKGYQDVFEKGLVRDYPLAIRHISGNIIDVLYNATVYKNESGEVQGVFAAARDITERKRAENELRRAHDELEIRVRERTSELAKANEALKAEIADRKKAQENLMISLNEKEILIKEVHHRVKNNLQIVSSMLELQTSYMKDKKAIMAFREGQNRISTMALIHEKLYRSKDLARIRFAEYIEELTSNLFFSYGVNSDQIKLKIDVGEIFFDINTAIPCGLIINEFVSNSIKHAFPEGRNGEISLKLQTGKDGKFILTASDDGIGFPPDLDFRKSETLGLKLVIILTKQLDGAIELDRSAGTRFVIIFSELKYKEMR